MISALTVGQSQPADLQRIRIGSGRSPPIRRSTTSIGTHAQQRQRGDHLLVFAGLGEIDERGLVELAFLMQRLDRALGGRVVARPGGCRLRWTPWRARAGSPPASPASRPRAGAAAPPRSPCSNRSRNSRGGMSGRVPTFSARIAVLFRWLDQRREASAPTAGPPGCRRRCARPGGRRGGPVRRSPVRAMPVRPEIASRCAWLLVLAISTRSASGSRGDCSSTGPATAMSSSWASRRTASTGALPTGARRCGQFGARLGLDLVDQAREDVVEQPTWSSLKWSRAVEKERCDPLQGRARRSAEPCWMTSSSSGISDAGAAILRSCGIDGRIKQGPSAGTTNMRGI